MNETLILQYKKEARYKDIARMMKTASPESEDSAYGVSVVAEAFEAVRDYTRSIEWYTRYCELDVTEEAYGLLLDVCFGAHDHDRIRKLLEKMEALGMQGYYYCAARYELGCIEGKGTDEQIERLKAFLDEQEEETYMACLALRYIEAGEEKKALKTCRKLIRLFQNGESAEYAGRLQKAIEEHQADAFVKKHKWESSGVFRHLREEKPEVRPEEKEPEATDKHETAWSLLDAFSSQNKKNKKKADEDTLPGVISNNMKHIIGMKELKEELNNFYRLLQFQKARLKKGFQHTALNHNFVVCGEKGTGKTEAAYVIANVLYGFGVLDHADVMKTDYISLVGNTADDIFNNINDLFTNAMNKVVLIEDIQDFYSDNPSAPGMEAVTQLERAIRAADAVTVIITGRKEETDKLLKAKHGFGECFMNRVELTGYTLEELCEIAAWIAKKQSYIISEEAAAALEKQLKKEMKQPGFEYTRTLKEILDEAALHMAKRVSKKRRLKDEDLVLMLAEDFEDEDQSESVEDLLRQLDEMTGLKEVKEQVHRMVSMVLIQQKAAESGVRRKTGFGTMHMVFKGNAGTGKTTVARIIGKIYKNLGILPNGNLIECTRRDLVSEFVGKTSKQVGDKIKQAMGGILFIDEAYALCKDDNDSFGQEAIDALVADIENYRDNLMVILAGYSEDMDQFLNKNQGLRSRLSTEIHFADYSVEEMSEIFRQMLKGKGLHLDVDLELEVRNLLSERSRVPDFGNARGVRNVAEKVIQNQNDRLMRLMMEGEPVGKNDYVIIRKEDITGITDETSVLSVEELMDKLNSLTGLSGVKNKVHAMIDSAMIAKKQKEMGIGTQGMGTLHLVFKGNAGTGKTTVARIIGKIYKRLGILPRGEVFVECGRSDLVGQYVGETAGKVKDKVRQAMGGILFIDEAYTLCKDDSDTFGKEAIDALVADSENHREDLMVIIAGYSGDMDQLLSRNQGLKSRFANEIIFEDYTVDEMMSIFHGMCQSRGLKLLGQLDDLVRSVITKQSMAPDFGNARGIRNILDKVIEQRNIRIADMIRNGRQPEEEEYMNIVREDLLVFGAEPDKEESVEELMQELNGLTGLKAVKEKVRKMMDTAMVNQKLQEMGMPAQSFGTLHMVFKGNAGTGKTTVARIIGRIYKAMGVLPQGHLVECGRSDLVAEYVGQTASKVKAKVKEARGGILFIDEAYTLSNGSANDFGKEAIDTLVADVENYRNDLMLIVAGYSREMDQFLDTNQGLKSRLSTELIFEDYTPDEMYSILTGMLKSRGARLDEGAEAAAKEYLAVKSGGKDFGNARGVRNVVDKVLENRNTRLAGLMRNHVELNQELAATVVKEDFSG